MLTVLNLGLLGTGSVINNTNSSHYLTASTLYHLFIFLYFFKVFFFFDVHHFLKFSLNIVIILFLFSVLVFWPRVMWLLAPRSVIKPISPAREGEILTTGLPGKSPGPCMLFNHSFFQLHEVDTIIITSLLQMTEKAMVPHSSTLAWKIPWTEEPGGLQSMGSRRVGHD